MKFVIDTESDNAKEKLDAFKSGWDMGLRIKASDVYDVIGASMPVDGEDQLFNPQVVQALKQSGGGGLADTFGQRFQDEYYRAAGQSRG